MRPGRAGAPDTPTYGGQAVIEGVMMRGPEGYCVAVRRPGGEIVTRYRPCPRPSRRRGFLGWPFVRGLAALVDALSVGIESLLYSAEEVSGEGEKLTRTESALTVVISLALSVGLFMILPTVAAGPLVWLGASPALVNLAEGLVRLAILVAYVRIIAFMPDIRRVYQYHGAEHKILNAYEATGSLSPADAASFSTSHARCGTSFLLFVVLVSIVLFSFLGWPNVWARIAWRLGLLPVIAGVAYELIQLGARSRSPLIRVLVAPGLWLQSLTTRPPDTDQLEVASAALAGVLSAGPGGSERPEGDAAGPAAEDAPGAAARQASAGPALKGR